jgi:hypothetical protein
MSGPRTTPSHFDVVATTRRSWSREQKRAIVAEIDVTGGHVDFVGAPASLPGSAQADAMGNATTTTSPNEKVLPAIHINVRKPRNRNCRRNLRRPRTRHLLELSQHHHEP